MAKGKRITTFAVGAVEELEPLRQPDSPATDTPEDLTEDDDTPEVEPEETPEDIEGAREGSIDPLTGQFNLFED